MGIWKKAAKAALIGSMLFASLACYVSVAIPTEIAQPTTQVEQSETKTPSGLEQVIDEEITLCAFNVKDFSRSKIIEDEADDPDVAEGTGRAIAYLMLSCDLTAVQEISDIEGRVIPYFLDNYLNIFPPGDFVARLSPRLGRIASGEAQKEQYGFIYDSSKLEILDYFTYDDGPDNGSDAFAREPFIGLFSSKEGNFTFVAVVIHTKPSDSYQEMMHIGEVVSQIYQRYPGERDVIVMGDTNLKEGFNAEIGEEWGLGRFYSIITDDTNLAGKPENPSLFDQIIINRDYTGEDFAGEAKVVRFDSGYNFVVPPEEISDHFLVKGIFYINRDTDSSSP